ncbi:hydroxyacid dehydrogenase [Pseudomonas frederiksbergensis]|uniref:Hydroxyacid dehydrogenase n=1 Tax=Pseudomonas frederiksbergensis TaxID=104087 RepID=A0A2S8H9C7_9PSED|nr:virulence RhuM family protein [Pseudomonas frederiksbergensis]PQO99088.1 hydroxyacid dehydrogenase [Pseudomonas frederiksbergensis]
MTISDLILYSTEDGLAQFTLREMNGQVWLTQLELAELYQTSKQNISKHIQAVLADGELAEAAVVNSKLTTAADGKEYLTQLYALPMIIAIGYRVRSTRGSQFRQWATRTLSEYMLKGFVMDDARLKEPRWDYFDELLERIRDIRSSEKRFYQKVRDLFSLAEDYRANEQDTTRLFAEVQNKLFFAVTGHTAAELIVRRADASVPNMNLLSFKGDRVRKADVVVAKNYLNGEELDQLNRLVSMFLDFAELRAKQRQHIKLEDWRRYIDSFMAFNEQPLLRSAGSVSHEQMKNVAHERYEAFDQKRRTAEAREIDTQELAELERLEKRLSSHKKPN